MTEIREIITHRRPHLDELVAIWLLRRFGEECFPGVARAKIVLRDAGAHTPDGRTARQWEEDGVLFIGLGGGRFDEHPNTEEGRKQGECAASLVARELKVDKDPALAPILKFVTLGDTQGVGGPFDLKALVDAINAYKPDEVSAVMRFVTLALDGLYAKNQQWQQAKQAYNEASVLIMNRPFRVVLVVSDNEAMRNVAFGRGVQVAILRRSSGHTQIFSNGKRGGPPMDHVVAELRRHELRERGEPSEFFSLRQREGTLAHWYYQPAGQFILNGSLTALEVPPTALCTEQIVEIVKEVLSK